MMLNNAENPKTKEKGSIPQNHPALNIRREVAVVLNNGEVSEQYSSKSKQPH